MSLSSFVFARFGRRTSSPGATALFINWKRKIQPAIRKRAGQQSLTASDLTRLSRFWRSVRRNELTFAARWAMKWDEPRGHWVKLFFMDTLGKTPESSWTTRVSICEQKETSRRRSCGHDWRSFFREAGLTRRVPADIRHRTILRRGQKYGH